MKLSIPKFHDRASLVIGVIAGLFLVACGAYNITYGNIAGNIIQMLVGVVLSAHCIDMIRYYKKHRIVKIEKTETHRIIYKSSKFFFKLVCFRNALKLAWSQYPFRIWLTICTVGIAVGIYAGVGMTNLVLLVAIACLGLGMEIANTSIETLLDIVHPSYSTKVKIVKDAFSAVPIFVYSAYVISWLILVTPKLW